MKMCFCLIDKQIEALPERCHDQSVKDNALGRSTRQKILS